MFGTSFFPIRSVILAIGLSTILMGVSSADDLRILVIDQQAVLRDSLAGRDIARQGVALKDQITKEVQSEQQAIVKQEDDLVKNGKLYSPAQRERKIKALDARKRSYPAFQQRKQQILQASVEQASNKVATALRPILQAIINERKANLLLDRQQVLYATQKFDITQEAIGRLNKVLTAVKVVRANLDIAPRTQAQSQVQPTLPQNRVQLPKSTPGTKLPNLPAPSQAGN